MKTSQGEHSDILEVVIPLYYIACDNKKIEPTYFPQFDKNRYKWFIHGYYIKVGQTQIILEGECCDRHTHISSTIKIIEVMNGLWPTLWSIIKCVVFT